MATLCRAFASEADAHAALDRLRSAGVARSQVRILMGEAVHDARDTPVGGFGAPTTGGAVVGAYAGAPHSAREAMGAFAGEGDAQRRGGFSDVDRETVTTYAADAEHVRVASHHDLERMLVDAGLDPAAATADVRALHQGRVLVLVQGTMGVDELAAVLDG